LLSTSPSPSSMAADNNNNTFVLGFDRNACLEKTKTINIVECGHVRGLLSEGPVWCAEQSKLIWLDIEGKSLNTYNPTTGTEECYALPMLVACFAQCISAPNKFICGTDKGIGWMRTTPGNSTGAVELVINPEAHCPNNRFNDGKCDRDGRFFAGTMSNVKPRVTGAASMYRIEHSSKGLTAQRVEPIGPVTVSNGLCWSADNKTMYYIDTPTRKIQMFEYDGATGIIGPRICVLSIPAEITGSPDGMSIDNEGMLWVCMFRGGCVLRVDPNARAIIGMLKMPTPHVTSCCFGGSGLDTLFITTALGGSEEDRQASKGTPAGALFAAKVGVKGSLLHTFKDI